MRCYTSKMADKEYLAITAFSDPNVSRSSGDAWFSKYKYPGYTWEDLMKGSADSGSNSYEAGKVLLGGCAMADRWAADRTFLCFDTRFLPEKCTIMKASLFIKTGTASYSDDFEGCWGVSQANPVNPASLQRSDWEKVINNNLVVPLEPGQVPGFTVIEFVFTHGGLSAIAKKGITKLCLREARYDIMNNEPEWNADFHASYGLETSEQAPIKSRPRLVIEYRD